SSALTEIAQKLLEDQEEIVRIRAAEFLGIVGKKNPQPTLINVVNTTGDPVVATEALNAVVLFKDFYDGRYPVTRDDFHPKTMGADVDDRLNYINGIPYPPKKKKNAVKPKGKP
ncbi:MAG: HEAT repeat domain-containing protein, partial [Planctomycetota bacterium]|nr:HEAT repeat domain-containing protein [Planctomycetota bacterium]